MTARGPRLPVLDGLLLVDKPRGPTSHDVVARVRRAAGQREVGHAGTLDPMATGLLVVGLGRATRLLRFVEAETKTYLATVTLGRSTSTEDADGETVEVLTLAPPSTDAVLEALAALCGRQTQQVPAYAAVKQGGVPLYARARRGEVVERPHRSIEVTALELRGQRGLELDLECTVSKGTYVRTLAVAVGERLGFPAHLSALRRTAIGPHLVARAIRDEDLVLRAEAGGRDIVESRVLPMEAAVGELAVRTVPRVTLAHGRRLDPTLAEGLEPGAAVRLVDDGGALGGIAEVVVDATGASALRYLCVLVAGGAASD